MRSREISRAHARRVHRGTSLGCPRPGRPSDGRSSWLTPPVADGALTVAGPRRIRTGFLSVRPLQSLTDPRGYSAEMPKQVAPFLMFTGQAEEAMTFYTSLFEDARV